MARIGSSEVGGVEACTFRLGEALMQRGHQVTLYGGQPKEEISFSSSQIPLRLFPYLETRKVPNLGTRFQRLIQRLHFAWNARRDLSEETFDAILIFKPYDFVAAWFWRKRGVRARIVASLHGTEFYPGDHWLASRHGGIDAIYAVNDSTARSLEKRYGRSCEIIPNFLDGQQFALLDRPSPPVEKLVLAVGRLVAIKGMDNLVRAFARVQAKIPDARLMLVGDGPERSNLEQLVRQLDLGGVVGMPGVLSEQDVIECHRKCWVYAQPSTGDESFSISTLEAFASGLSVVASDRVRVAREFQKDAAVEIYPAHDATGLEQRLTQSLSESWEENRKRGQRARTIVEKHFLADVILPKIERACANPS